MKKRFSNLGLDAHSDHCQLAVISPDGALLSSRSYPTSANELIEAVSLVKGRKKMVVEESQMADWVKRTLEPYVDELIIADPKLNAWIAKAQQMNDKIASVRLAELLKGGYIHPVHHGDSKRQQFKELVLHYHDIVKQITRFKNKIKGGFTAKAINVKGNHVYQQPHYHQFMKKLDGYPFVQMQYENYFAILKNLKKLQANILRALRRFYKDYPEIKQFCAIPGIGQVSAFTISAVVDTPHRFSNKRKFWSYCCLAKSDKISNGKLYRSTSSRRGHRLLKFLLLQAAKRIIASNKQCFYRQAADRLIARGVTMKNARRTVARQLASCILKIWKTGEPYRDIAQT